jgi:hypothetical protein
MACFIAQVFYMRTLVTDRKGPGTSSLETTESTVPMEPGTEKSIVWESKTERYAHMTELSAK